MTQRVKEILEQAASLSIAERAEIAEELLSTLDEGEDLEVEAAWEAEIARRIDDLDSGRVKCIPWETVRATR